MSSPLFGNPTAESAGAADSKWEAPGQISHSRGANISHAASHNRKLILHEIRANPGIDRGALARITGLTSPAVFKIVTDLLEEKWIVGTRVKDGSRGQPRSVLGINPHAAYSLGLNVDRDRLCLVALDFAGGVRIRLHESAGTASPAQARDFFERCIAIIREQRSFPLHKVVAVGLSIPDDYAAPDGESWPDAVWTDVFWPLKHLPFVRENDAAAASIGEMMFGAGLQVDSFFYVYVSIGLGGGLVVNRQYVRGRHGRSGELGYMPQVNPFREEKTSLEKTIGQSVSLQGLADSLGWNEQGVGMAGAHEHPVPSSDAKAVEWIEEASELLYLPLLSVLCTIDPDAIFVGGRLPQTLVEPLCRSLNARLSMGAGIHSPEMVVRPGQLTEDAAAVGAAVLALSTVWDRRDDG